MSLARERFRGESDLNESSDLIIDWRELIHGTMFSVVFLEPKSLNRFGLWMMQIILGITFYVIVSLILLRVQ
jgi:hypothetical protein